MRAPLFSNVSAALFCPQPLLRMENLWRCMRGVAFARSNVERNACAALFCRHTARGSTQLMGFVYFVGPVPHLLRCPNCQRGVVRALLFLTAVLVSLGTCDALGRLCVAHAAHNICCTRTSPRMELELCR